MTWPSAKGIEKRVALSRMTAEERRKAQNEILRLRAGNLCTKCKTGQRFSTMTICEECNRERKRDKVLCKRWSEAAKRRKRLKIAEVYKGKCLICNLPVGEILTRNLFIRYFCGPCARKLRGETFQNRYLFRLRTREIVRDWKERNGILPKDAWQTLPGLDGKVRSQSW